MLKHDAHVSYVRVSDYIKARGTAKRSAIPARPGIYIWTIDIMRVPAVHTVPGMLNRFKGLVLTSRRDFTGRIEPYTEISISDAPRDFSALREGQIMASFGDPHADWMFECMTLFQRPLYIGKAGDLATRFTQHLRPESRLCGYLRNAGLGPRDCAVILLPLPSPAPVPYHYELSDDPDVGEPDDAEGESDHVLDNNPKLKALLSSAESTLIRTTRPLLNVQMP
jgi:hypothetical protein